MLFLLLSGCSFGETKTVTNNCGIAPKGFIEKEIGNDPNYVFKIDPTFNPVSLIDVDGNVAIVNSYEECQHYVQGGWGNLLVNETSQESSSNIFYYLFGGTILTIINFLNFKELKKNNIDVKNLLNYLPVIFFSASVVTVLLKIVDRGVYFTIYSQEQLVKFFSLTLSMIFLYLIAKLISKSLKIESISLSISYFLVSFFLFDIIFMPITKGYSFSNTFVLVSILWVVLFILKKINLREILLTMGSYFLLHIFNKMYFMTLSDLSEYKIKNSDVEVQWLPISKMIFNNNLYHSLENNIIPGYGMMLSYTQAVIHKINHFTDTFSFITTDSNLILLLSLFIFLDLKILMHNKILISASFLIIVLDDGWLRFLLGNSMMLEGLVSFLFASFLINLNKFYFDEKIGNKKFIFLLFFSSLIFSKQFIETIVFLILLTTFLFTKNRLFTLGGFGVIIINNIYNRIYFGENKSVEYIDKDLTEIILDIILQRNADWGNLYLIFQKLFEFKFIFAALILICFFHILNTNQNRGVNYTRNFIFFTIFLNVLLVMILYIFLWQGIEIESSFRYIMNVSDLIFASLIIEFETYQRKKLPY